MGDIPRNGKVQKSRALMINGSMIILGSCMFFCEVCSSLGVAYHDAGRGRHFLGVAAGCVLRDRGRQAEDALSQHKEAPQILESHSQHSSRVLACSGPLVSAFLQKCTLLHVDLPTMNLPGPRRKSC